MRIVHISDLHFGAHSGTLMADFLSRMKALRPEVIVCTVDVADQPDKGLLEQGKQFLAQAEGCCAQGQSGAPRLLVVPGNHDYRESGWLWALRNSFYKKFFGDFTTDYFFRAAQEEPGGVDVWIFGFDSAQRGKVGGSGKIDATEIERFHSRHAELKGLHGATFENAFKIVLVHHHPLPVNRKDDNRARWLTMTNAGQFLSAVLLRKVDLVLHGHEHLQARTGFSSTLGANRHSVSIISLGATLRTLRSGDQFNWFGLVTIDRGGARADFYQSIGDAWSEEPVETFEIRSAESALDATWQRRCEQAGFVYREVASMTLIDEDGDARRIVECEDLTILHNKSPRSPSHVLHLPPTSGYLDRLNAFSKEFTIKVDPRIRAADRVKSWEGRLVFEKPIAAKKPVSYRYDWYAVNSFALDKTQFDYRYGNDPKRLDNIEFTHFAVEDPIEELTVIVQLPPGFNPESPPRIRIAEVDHNRPDSRDWVINAEAESEAGDAHALHYYDAMKVAALRVRRPHPGLSYGIQWEVPEGAREIDDGTIVELRRVWKAHQTTAPEHTAVLNELSRIILVARDFLMPGWRGPVDISFMFFDGVRELVALAAILDDNLRAEADRRNELVYRASLPYGDGIGGRAFKSNRLRVYVAPESGPGADPDYYTVVPGAPVHTVLVAFPVHKPEPTFRENPLVYESKRPFGVVSLGSTRADCPLQNLRLPERNSAALTFQNQASALIYNFATQVFLGQAPIDHGGPGA